jgi:hypothetical protein
MPVDAALPGIDVAHPDARSAGRCADRTPAPPIYLLGESNTLYGFDPATAAVTTVASAQCAAGAGSPFSLGVDRAGFAYVIFRVGSLYRISLATGDCARTGYRTNDLISGMAFVTDPEGAGNTLFVARDVFDAGSVLATLDPAELAMTDIAPFSPSLGSVELTGTGDGRLFAFFAAADAGGSIITEIDPATAKVIAESPLPDIAEGVGWAFAFWGGRFYIFTTASGGTMTTLAQEWDPATQRITTVATLPGDWILAAGVSTCAPVAPPH